MGPCGGAMNGAGDELQLSVVVMAYDEVESLEAVVRELDGRLRSLAWPYELLIVDDGSGDGTGVVAERLGRELANVRVIHHAGNQGLGAVYRTGFAHARGAWLSFFPADGQFPAAILGQFAALTDQADLVLGCAPNRRQSLVARVLSRAEKALYRLWVGPLPKFQGVLMFRRTLLRQPVLISDGRGWTVLMELIIRAARDGCRIVSVPTEIRPRLRGHSKVRNLPTMWANFRGAMALRRHLSHG